MFQKIDDVLFNNSLRKVEIQMHFNVSHAVFNIK